MVLILLNLTQDKMSKLSKKKRKQVRPAAVAKESTRVSKRNVPTKPRKKLKTKKQVEAERKKYAHLPNLKVKKPKMKMGVAGGDLLGGVGKGAIKGVSKIVKYVGKSLAKKAVKKL
jgi:hypothetical protein